MVGFKNRYLVMEVLLDPSKDRMDFEPVTITQLNLSNAIKDSMLTNFGECGLASSLNSFQVKYLNPITKLCIIRTTREDHQRVWAAITMIRSIGNCSVVINLLDLSGMFEKNTSEIILFLGFEINMVSTICGKSNSLLILMGSELRVIGPNTHVLMK